MGLLWNFMGFSTGYTFFAGLGECVGGVNSRDSYKVTGAPPNFSLLPTNTSGEVLPGPPVGDFHCVANGDGTTTATGTFKAKTVAVVWKPADKSRFLLMNRGFHWISEEPFHR